MLPWLRRNLRKRLQVRQREPLHLTRGRRSPDRLQPAQSQLQASFPVLKRNSGARTTFIPITASKMFEGRIGGGLAIGGITRYCLGISGRTGSGLRLGVGAGNDFSIGGK